MKPQTAKWLIRLLVLGACSPDSAVGLVHAQIPTSYPATFSSGNGTALVDQVTTMLDKLHGILTQNRELSNFLGGDLTEAKTSKMWFGPSHDVANGFDVRWSIKHGVQMAKVDPSIAQKVPTLYLETFPAGSYEFEVFATNHFNRQDSTHIYYLNTVLPHFLVGYYFRTAADDDIQKALQKTIDAAFTTATVNFLVGTGMKIDDVKAIYPELFGAVKGRFEVVRRDPVLPIRSIRLSKASPRHSFACIPNLNHLRPRNRWLTRLPEVPPMPAVALRICPRLSR